LTRRRVGAVAAFALLWPLACASPEERFASHLERAEALIEQGNAADAMIELQSALKIDPDHADLNQRLGQLLYDRGTLPAAAFHFGEAYRLDPSRVDAAIAQAEILWRTAPRRANQIISNASSRFPDDPRVHRGRSRIAVLDREPEVAITAAERAIELAPEDPDNWAQLGAAWASRVRDLHRREQPDDPTTFEAGIAAFQKVDELEDGHVGARVEIARLYGQWDGHEEQAAEEFRSAIALAKERDDASSVLFAARKMLGYSGRAKSLPLRIEALRELVAAAPKRVLRWEALARAVGEAEGPRAEDAVYAQLLAVEPKLPSAHVAYSVHLARRDRELDAIAHIDRTIASGIDAAPLWEQLIRLELGKRRISDARDTLEEMKDRHPDAPATIRSEARIAAREGRHDRAIELLEAIPDDRNPETARLRALAELNRGNLAAALAAIERAVALPPRGDIPSLRLMAEIHGRSSDWAGALRTLALLEDLGHALSPHELLLQARSHYELGDTAAGYESLVVCLSAPTPPPAAGAEFARREGQARPAEARAYLEKVLRVAPGNFQVLEAITVLDVREGQAGAALARLDKLVESQLAGPNVLLLRAQLLRGTGQLDRAEADALRAFEADPDLEDAVGVLYSIYRDQGKISEARRSFEEADSVGVLHSGARVLLGRLYLGEGDVDKALATYEQVLEEAPDLIAPKADLAYLLAVQGDDLDRALTYAEEAQRARPDDPAIADTVGFVYYQMKRYDAAVQQFLYSLDLAESMGGSIPTVNYHLGLALRALGRQEEALGAFERALALDADFAEAEDARVQIEAVKSAAAEAKSAS
jgi:tetratricopeptide (TPR) repeat protein